jgi:hypothetical protein
MLNSLLVLNMQELFALGRLCSIEKLGIIIAEGV